MRVSKYVHSCLLLEEAGEKLLFDPGVFSFNEGRVTPEHFADVTTVIITHTHADHLDVNALRRIIELSGAAVYGNHEVVETLRREAIEATRFDEGTRRLGAFTLQAIETPHEEILSDKPFPLQTAFLVNDRLLNTADSFRDPLCEFEGVEVLALPITAPFLTEVGVMEFIEEMQPRHVIPLHDGYARDFFVKMRHQAYGAFCEKLGVIFHPLAEPGASVDL